MEEGQSSLLQSGMLPSKPQGIYNLLNMIKRVDRSKMTKRRPRGVAPSLSETHPELAAQWHPIYNGDKKPEDFSTYSDAVVWWLCPRSYDHVFQRAISRRTASSAFHKACPYCSGDLESIAKPLRRSGWKYKSSILETHLAIASQWDFQKNGRWMPEDFTAGSTFRAWWKCPRGHTFQKQITQRTAVQALSMGCAECAAILRRGRKRGTISLAISHPKLCEQWDYDLNGTLWPEDVSHGSARYVHWICPQGPDHKFKGPITSRARSPSENMACPFCAGRKPSVTNSLASCFPDLAKEYSSRNELSVNKVVAGSGKRVWWQCRHCSHEWQASPGNRTDPSQLTGCPRCNLGEPVDLRKLPNLSKFFDKELNEGSNPNKLNSGRKYWLRCPRDKDHVFESILINKDAVEKCPYCRNRKASKSNNLACLYPAVAEEFHPIRNGELTSEDVIPGSRKKFWWQCRIDKEHEWEARAFSRTKRSTGCPFCSGLKRTKGNSLQATFPKIAKELHPKKNGELQAKDIAAGSRKKVWWLCKMCSHEWQTWVFSRTKNGRDCPQCRSKIGKV